MSGTERILTMCGGQKAQLTTLTTFRNRRQALAGGGRGHGVGRAHGLLSLHTGPGSCHFEVPDICGERIWSEVSLASALLHAPCHSISLSVLPTPRFVNLPRLLYDVCR